MPNVHESGNGPGASCCQAIVSGVSVLSKERTRTRKSSPWRGRTASRRFGPSSGRGPWQV